MAHDMITHNPHSTASVAGHPVHAMLIPFPIAFFVATFVCDLVFWRTGNTAWVTGTLWLLGAAVEGGQVGQTLTITYTDGTTDTLYQNFSDWFQPQRYPGEGRGVRMNYRNMGDGSKDPRTFYAYAYGFAVNPAKTVKSVTLPNNDFVKVVGITLAK